MCFPTFQVKLTRSVWRNYDFGIKEIDAWTAEQTRTAKPGETIRYLRPLPRSWRRPTQVWTSSGGTDWQPVEVVETKDGWPAITTDWTNRRLVKRTVYQGDVLMYVSLQCPSQAEIKKLLRKKQDEEEDCTEDWPPVNDVPWEPKEDSRCVRNGKVVNWTKRHDSPQFPSPPTVNLN